MYLPRRNKLTKSKAAIFLRLVLGPWLALSFVHKGENLPTRSVAGVSSLGARSCQVIFSGGFCEDGVKKEATADSAKVSNPPSEVSKGTVIVAYLW